MSVAASPWGARRRLAGLAALLAVACKGAAPPAEDEHHEHAEHAPSHDPAEQEEGAETVVRVERGMLRDLRITTRAAESRPAGDAVSVLGELRVNEDAYAEIGSSTSARVARVLVSAGDAVKVGQALVELESPEVGRTRAALLTAGARLALAQQTVARRRELAADQIVPQREMQEAQADLAQASAEHRAAQEVLSALGAVRGTGARFVLTSPIAGTVLERNAARGQLVDAARPLFIIAGMSRLWLVVHAFERDALRMTVGAAVRVVFPALPGQSVSGVLTRLGSRVDPSSRTIDVRIELDNPSGVLRPGMSATALVPLGQSERSVVTVPVEAVQRQPQGWSVFLPTAAEGSFEVRAIGRGRDLSGEVEVISGLRAGELVVVEGAFLLKAEADKARGGGDEHHH